MQSELVQSLLLGLVQGVTEFLPISSSGHLALFEILTDMKTDVILLSVLLHAGTLGAICFYYRGSLARIFSSCIRLLKHRSINDHEEERANITLAAKIILADIITILLAIVLYKPTESISSETKTIGVFLVITAILLILTRFIFTKEKPLTWRAAAIIGFFQGIAVLPGISRSGATIFAALLFTSNRKEAVRFSFLIAIPVLLGAAVFETAGGISEITGNLLLYLPGTIIAFITGWFCLKLLEKITVGRHLHWFALYLIPSGLALAFIVG